MSWLIAAYAAVVAGVVLYSARLRRLRRDLPAPPSRPRRPHG